MREHSASSPISVRAPVEDQRGEHRERRPAPAPAAPATAAGCAAERVALQRARPPAPTAPSAASIAAARRRGSRSDQHGGRRAPPRRAPPRPGPPARRRGPRTSAAQRHTPRLPRTPLSSRAAMATAASASAAQDRARGRRGSRPRRRRPWRSPRCWTSSIGPWFLNYDARYALLWARDLAHGLTPEYTADFAPTPHPLQTAFGLLALPFGDASDDVLTLAVLLCLRRARVPHVPRSAPSCSRPGSASWPRSSCSPARRSSATRCSPTRTSRSPRSSSAPCCWRRGARARGAAVLALLAVAGLLRPEAWVLSGLYVLWVLARGRPQRRRAQQRDLAVLRRAAGRSRRRAGDLGRHGLAGHRRPAALAARHGGPGDRQRPPPHGRRRARTGPRSTSATRCASRWCSACRSGSRSPGSTPAGRASCRWPSWRRWSPCSRSGRCSGCR